MMVSACDSGSESITQASLDGTVANEADQTVSAQDASQGTESSLLDMIQRIDEDASIGIDSTVSNPDSASNAPVVDASMTDATEQGQVDASVLPSPAQRLGQCANDDDCPIGINGQSCSRALPGGACMGCGTDGDCPADTTCNLGTCITECSNDRDCPLGLMCLSSGRCAAMRCRDGQCPDARFSCSDSDRCTRRPCTDETACVAGTFCQDGLCLEDAWR